ncbi:MAG: efflux RND transporter periplasmic adaptor subunit, partial [Pseudomonadota bacterium]|nr:efflux RND transporter periplasmic adaptor subunit [Pseudomonadota bacterium]
SSLTPGEVIGPGTEAMTVADLHTVMVLAQVPEAAATQVTVGDAAEVGIAGGQRHWEGRVATLGAQLDPQSRTLPARIQIANPDLTLRAGMYVDVVITRTLNRISVVVPAPAVQLVADKHVVFTPESGDRFQSHEVQIGVERPDTVEISGGLKPGDVVVTQGSFQLKALLLSAMLGGD